MTVPSLSPQEVVSRWESGPIEVIDVRTPAEYRALHASVGKNVPLDSLDPEAYLRSRNGSSDEALYVICQTGARARKACERFQAAGFANVILIEGGIKAWSEAGLPVNRAAKAMSLERQVRVAAGSLVLAGVILGVMVQPYFIGLSAFVGAGLVFAGITDTCGMGMLLAKMPWNRVGSSV